MSKRKKKKPSLVSGARGMTGAPVCGPHVGGEMRNVCSIRPVAGDGGLNTEVGLGLSIEQCG